VRVAVAGGTGTVGRHIAQACRDTGHSVTVLSRRRGTDLTNGAGLDRALEGVDVVIHASTGPALAEGKATAHTIDVAGPEVEYLPDLARKVSHDVLLVGS
jgi:uncharacterized protein YbjT (DUF2867 family)